jgi:hypothetical protein
MFSNYSNITHDDNILSYRPVLDEQYNTLDDKKQMIEFKNQNKNFYKNTNLINTQGEFQKFDENSNYSLQSNNELDQLSTNFETQSNNDYDNISSRSSSDIKDIINSVKKNKLTESNNNKFPIIEEFDLINKQTLNIQILIIGILIGIVFIFLVDIIGKINRKFK